MTRISIVLQLFLSYLKGKETEGISVIYTLASKNLITVLPFLHLAVTPRFRGGGGCRGHPKPWGFNSVWSLSLYCCNPTPPVVAVTGQTQKVLSNGHSSATRPDGPGKILTRDLTTESPRPDSPPSNRPCPIGSCNWDPLSELQPQLQPFGEVQWLTGGSMMPTRQGLIGFGTVRLSNPGGLATMVAVLGRLVQAGNVSFRLDLNWVLSRVLGL
ncbi:hypothetical protein GH714_036841 [Hevea brasiliensis]|uniref:Uncharacterized protein n=1 Tax=Hevea brasiliensis TaxID=3981 RepID=A0A6A6MMA0_HEVBR|nr:hypothetical protein GH714_036841 [Hevea brasiliensis]